MQSNQPVKNNDGESNPIVVRKCNAHSANIIQNLQVMLEQQQLCDVTLVSQNEKYKVEAHRAILSAASKYFFTMFNGSFLEAHAKEVKLTQVDENSLKLVINFIYTSSIELATDTVKDILKTAHLFELHGLETFCCDFLEEQLDTSNCLGIAFLAERYNLTKLYETAESFACQHFDKLRQSDEFFDMDVDQLSKFISSDEIGLESEEDVVYSLMAWVEHDSEVRKQFIAKLANCIRFPFLTPNFIANIMESACNTIEFERIICKAYKWHLLPECRESLFSAKQTLPRYFENTVIAISGWNSTKDNLSVGIYYSKLNKWFYTQWPALPEKRTCFGSTTFNGKLIIAGGILSSRKVTNRVDSLDLRTLKWTKLPPMRTKRHSFGITSVNNQIYVVGGNERTNNTFTSVEKWDPLTAQWQYVSFAARILLKPLAFTMFNTLFVSSYYTITDNNPFNINEQSIYEPETNKHISQPRDEGTLLGAGTVGTEYFMIVYKDHISQYKKYQDRPCIPIQSVAIGDQYTDCVVSKNRIIVFGENEFLEYHPFGNEWKTMPQLENTEGKVVVITK